MSENQFKFKKGTFLIPILAVLSIWLVYTIEIGFGFNFNKFGIYPKTIVGLRGILFSPFIHSVKIIIKMFWALHCITFVSGYLLNLF